MLTYSGTYVNQQSPANPDSPHGAWEYHEHWIAAAPAKPLRIWMEVGENDNRFNDPESTYHNWVLANQRMAAAPGCQGLSLPIRAGQNRQGTSDRRAVQQTLPEALEWLWKDYPAK